ncbi:MAG: tryptophan synthase subunit alpha [Candidatus Omnitrophica bacterium]|nr:tryptophan synthase subunit alpha [Candidatus Omnitrophota bacterium]
MNRIDLKFKDLAKQGKKAFIAFLTAGYPSLSVTEQLILELGREQADIIEIGVPFSDPIADGPVIQEASHAALKNGVTMEKIFRMVKKLRSRTQVPLCLMLYYNIIFTYGEKRFIDRAFACGIDGVIIPDLPVEESGGFSKCARARGIHTISFISPVSSFKRMENTALSAEGFIYYISLTGVTGPRMKLPADLAAKVRAVKRMTGTPVCVGFGVSSPEQVKDIFRFADGVIVGSALIRMIKSCGDRTDLVKKICSYVSFLRAQE